MLSVAAAILFLHERPSTLGLLGGALIVAAILALVVGSTAGIGAALATGAFTAAYTVWDAHAVTTLHQPPLFYGWAFGALMAAALLPFARDVHDVWRDATQDRPRHRRAQPARLRARALRAHPRARQPRRAGPRIERRDRRAARRPRARTKVT